MNIVKAENPLISLLDLYPYESPNSELADLTVEPDCSTMADDQKEAFKLMAAYTKGQLKDTDGRPYDMFSLVGEAGTGKTW